MVPTTGMLASGMPRSLTRPSFGWLTEKLPSETCPVFSLSTSGYLIVSDFEGKVIWSSSNTQQAKASRASILDTGNFILLGAQNTSEIVWESFANPTDTFFPTMKFWKGLKLHSWKSLVDPAPGPFILEMTPSPGMNNFLLQYKNGVPYYSTGEWTGSYFATLPGAKSDSLFMEELVVFSPTRMYYTYGLTPKVGPMMVREALNSNACMVYVGLMESTPPKEAFIHAVVCMASTQEMLLLGDCPSINGTTENFLQVSDKSLSDQEVVQYTQESTLQGCKTACLNNCSCMAFAFTDSNSAVCKLWFGDLLGMQATSSDSQPFFIRLAAYDLPPNSNKGRSSRVIVLSISILLGVAILSSLFIGAWLIHRRRRRLLQKNVKEPKLVGRDFSRVLMTTRGTRGYLATEWLSGLPITMKVDVYSFGMTLLELISGRRNSDLNVQDSQHYFPTWAAAQIHKGNTMGIVDERIADKADVEEVRRAAVVSIMCIQKDEKGRPSMAQVVRILEGKSQGDNEQYERYLLALIDDHCV
ncbi:hypothetical protein SUGI_0645460 [Cryptomeria japonica]|nr:hypothetical protein SUGI_0645460 [Cryptomeria japonica]